MVKSDIDMYLNIIVKTLGTKGAKKELKKNLTETFKGARQENIAVNKSLGKLGKNFDSFRGIMSLGIDDFKQIANGQIKFNSLGAKNAVRLRKMTHGFRGFKMALLGVMFAGQNLNKSMMALLQPAMQARGITEKWQKGLKDIFLPIIKAIEPAIKGLAKWMKELSTPTKLVIGGFVLFTAVLGKILFLIGSFGLAIGSLIMLLPSSRTKLTELTASMAGYAATTTAATIATMSLNAATMGLGGVGIKILGTGLGKFGGVLSPVIKNVGKLSKAIHGSGLHAAIVSTTPEIKKFTFQFAKTSKLLKASKKIIHSTEKAFKGSGLHAAVLATRGELKKFSVGLLNFDFILGNSGKKVTWYTKLWDGFVGVWTGITGAIDTAIKALKEFLGLESPTLEPYEPYVPPPLTNEGIKNIQKEQKELEEIGLGRLRDEPVVSRFIGPSPAVNVLKAAAGGMNVPDSTGFQIPDFYPKIPTAPIPTAPDLTKDFEGVIGGAAGQGVSTAFPEQYGAGNWNVQVYVDGSEVTSRFNSSIVDETKVMGGY